MPGTIEPGQMFDHELNPLKGWFQMAALDKVLELDSAEEPDELFAGMAMYIDPTSGKFKIGVADGAPTIFNFANGMDFDTNSDVGNISGGKIGGLVAFGAYEFWSTEFVAGAYPPNTPLTAENTVGANRGKLKAGTLYTDQILGIVSDGAGTNEYSKAILTFWPCFIPPIPA